MRISPFAAVVLVGGFLLLFLSVPNLGPAFAAMRGDGVWGTFTARTLSCVRHPGHESCSWTGEYRSDDGLVVREQVAMYASDRQSFSPDASSRAFDTGRRGHVYGPGGSNEWIMVSLLLVAGLLMILSPLLKTRPFTAGRGMATRRRA